MWQFADFKNWEINPSTVLALEGRRPRSQFWDIYDISFLIVRLGVIICHYLL